MMQRRPIITMTRKEFDARLQAAVQEQVEADEKVLNDALARQIEQDAVNDFQYFHTAAYLVLHRTFKYGSVRLSRFFDALEKLMKKHYSPKELTNLLRAETGFEFEVKDTVEANK